MPFAGQHILIVGLGKTGVALTRFLAAQGARLTVTDPQSAADLAPARAQITDLEVRLELGVAEPTSPGAYDVIVPSPGVPPELPWLARAAAAGVPVVGELEIATRFLEKPVIAITGTNGKTTTTTLVGELLAASGRRVLVGGNIGTPLISLLASQGEADCLVLEVSSFQLDTAPSFHPRAAALLNISADHLDRYPDFAAYVRSKAAIFRHQGPEDLAVLNADDPQVAALAPGLRSRVHLFSTQQAFVAGAWRNGSAVMVRLSGRQATRIPMAGIRLPGGHNQENIMAALLLALDLGADPETCIKVLGEFSGLPHRVEWVASHGGVDFYDDSKGTNVGAVVRSLEYFDRPVVLIAGGRDKGGDYSPLAPLVRRGVKALILVGEAREKIRRELGRLTATREAADLEEATSLAWEAARSGDVVLLSPACSSFDMFTDYAARGRAFQTAVRRLIHGQQQRPRD